MLAWHPAPGEWCAMECIGHIIEADRRGFNGRIRSMLDTPDLTFVESDQEAAARERNDCQRTTAELLAEFNAVRQDGVALVESLTAADLERGGMHPAVGRLYVRDLLHEWVHHDRNHFRLLRCLGRRPCGQRSAATDASLRREALPKASFAVPSQDEAPERPKRSQLTSVERSSRPIGTEVRPAGLALRRRAWSSAG